MSGRGVLLARFGEGDEGLAIAIAHLSLGRQSRLAQLSFIAELLSEHPHAVLMGDFNCASDRPEMDVLYKHTRLQPPACAVHTFPSWKPQRAIDHRSEEHTSTLQSLMRISYAVFCLKTKNPT